jgi:TPR repeat protein
MMMRLLVPGLEEAQKSHDPIRSIVDLAENYIKQKAYNEALVCLDKSGELGDVESLRKIGVILQGSYAEVPPALYNLSGSQIYLLRAIELGNVAANYDLGMALYQLKQFAEAIRYFEIAKENKDARGLLSLGKIYDLHAPAAGMRVSGRFFDEMANDYYQQALVAGQLDARQHLHIMLRVPHDEIKGFDAIKNDAQALYEKAVSSLRTQEVFYEGVTLLEAAIKLNSADALCVLSEYCLHRNDSKLKLVPKNLSRALRSIKRAVELGSIRAQNLWGDYYTELGDHAKAKEKYELAAAKHDKDALFNLAKIYHHGVGLAPKNIIKARMYYQLAHQNGHTDADRIIRNLGRVPYSEAPDLLEVVEDPEHLLALLKKSVAVNGNSEKSAVSKTYLDAAAAAGNNEAINLIGVTLADDDRNYTRYTSRCEQG